MTDLRQRLIDAPLTGEVKRMSDGYMSFCARGREEAADVALAVVAAWLRERAAEHHRGAEEAFAGGWLGLAHDENLCNERLENLADEISPHTDLEKAMTHQYMTPEDVDALSAKAKKEPTEAEVAAWVALPDPDALRLSINDPTPSDDELGLPEVASPPVNAFTKFYPLNEGVVGTLRGSTTHTATYDFGRTQADAA